MNADKPLPKPVDWDELYPGRFLKASEFKGKQVTLRIAAVDIEKLVGTKGPQIKGVISFERTEKQWAINKTNGECVKAMFGRNVQNWVGKRVTLFAGIHNDAPCIRVWGSPDIDRDFEVTIQLPRKNPFQMTMHKVGPGGSRAQAPQPAPTRQPEPPPVTEREPGSDDNAGSDYDADLSRSIDAQLAMDEQN